MLDILLPITHYSLSLFTASNYIEQKKKNIKNNKEKKSKIKIIS